MSINVNQFSTIDPFNLNNYHKLIRKAELDLLISRKQNQRRKINFENDVLVHDLIELNNLLNHDKPSQEQILEEAEAEEDDGLQQELERQRKLNELEGRAKSARESAASSSGFDAIEDSNASDDGTVVVARRAPLVSTRNIADVRKGFIWAKVLDEPRFKRRWSTQYR